MSSTINIRVRTKDESSKMLRTISRNVESAFRGLSGVAMGLTAAVAGVVGGLGGLVFGAISAAKDLDTLSRQTGLSIKSLQDLDAQAVGSGTKTGTLAQGIQALKVKLAEAGTAGSKVAEALGPKGLDLAIVDLNGKLLPMDELLPKITSGLRGIEDPTKRAQVASGLFGDAMALELLPVLSKTDDEAKAISDQLDKLAPKLSEDQVKALSKAGSEWDLLTLAMGRMKGHLASELLPIFDRVVEVLKENLKAAFEAAREKIEELVKAFEDLDEETQEFIIKGIALVAGLTAVTAATAILSKLFTGEFATAFTAISLKAGLVTGGLVLLGIGLWKLYNENEVFRTKVQELWKGIKETAVGIFDELKEIWKEHGETITETVTVIGAAITGLLLPKIALMVLETTIAAAKTVAKWVLMSVQATIHAARIAAAWVVAAGPVGWGLAAVAGVATAVFLNWDAIQKRTAELWTELKRVTNEVWGEISTGLGKTWDEVKKHFDEVWGEIKAEFTGLVDKAVSWGQDIMNGLWDGMKGVASRVSEWVSGFVDGMVDKVKSVLKIQSPSGVFADIGENMMAGLQQGLQGAMGGPAAALGGAVPAMGMNAARGAVSFAPSIAVNGSTGMTRADFERMLDSWWHKAQREIG